MDNRSIKLLVATAGAVMTALVLGVVGWIFINSRDIAPVDTSDLAPEKVEVPDQENADLLFGKAFQSFQWPKDDRRIEAMLDGKAWEEEYVADLVSRNAETLALLKQGLACPQYQSREAGESEESKPYLQRDKMAKLMALKAVYELRTGHGQVAWETARDLLRFGSLVEANPTTSFDYGLGMVAMERGLQIMGRLLCECPLDEAGLVLLSEQLSHTASLDQGWARAIKLEYDFIAGSIDDVASSIGSEHPVIAGYMCQPNRMKADLARFYRTMIENVSQPYSEMNLPAAEPNPSAGSRRSLLLLRPNGMFRLVKLRPDYLNSYLRRKCEIQSHLDGLRMVVACRIYEMRHGRLPETLDALVPELHGTVPADPFDGKPFRYARGCGGLLRRKGPQGLVGPGRTCAGRALIRSCPQEDG